MSATDTLPTPRGLDFELVKDRPQPATPPLPTDDSIPAAAVRSVAARGFYDSTPWAAKQDHVMAQYLRLVEEVGEYHSARVRNRHNRAAQAAELADVAIVVAQIAWLTGLRLSSLGRMPLPGTAFVVEVGELGRALRKWDGSTLGASTVHLCLMRLSALAYISADQIGQRLDSVILEKLNADEGRGYQHGGAT